MRAFCGQELSSGPETLAGKTLLPSGEASCDVNGAPAPDIPDHLGNSIPGEDQDRHMHSSLLFFSALRASCRLPSRHPVLLTWPGKRLG